MGFERSNEEARRAVKLGPDSQRASLSVCACVEFQRDMYSNFSVKKTDEWAGRNYKKRRSAGRGV